MTCLAAVLMQAALAELPSTLCPCRPPVPARSLPPPRRVTHINGRLEREELRLGDGLVQVGGIGRNRVLLGLQLAAGGCSKQRKGSEWSRVGGGGGGGGGRRGSGTPAAARAAFLATVNAVLRVKMQRRCP